MILYLCRHGAAVQGDGMADEERTLTEEGVEKMHRAAKGFARLEPDVRIILTSPLLRARETADILQEALGKAQGRQPKLALCPGLSPPGRLEATLTALRPLLHGAAPGGALLVGHEPYLSHWIGKLCFGRDGSLEMKKGAIAALEFGSDLHAARLLWLMPPAALRMI